MSHEAAESSDSGVPPTRKSEKCGKKDFSIAILERKKAANRLVGRLMTTTRWSRCTLIPWRSCSFSVEIQS